MHYRVHEVSDDRWSATRVGQKNQRPLGNRNGIKPRSGPESPSSSSPQYHASPLSTPCFLSRRALGLWGIPRSSTSPPSTAAAPAQGQELTCSGHGRRVPFTTLCTTCSGAHIIPPTSLPLVGPGGCQIHRRTPGSRWRVCKCLRGDA